MENYRPDTAILELGPDFYDPVDAADFPETVLRYRDDRAAVSVGLESLSDADWIAHFGRYEPLPGNIRKPLALRYHGHQFQHYNPDLGDGRGFLFAQTRDARDRLMDLGTKGSGKTPYSRRGDGRLTLLGGVREILAARYLEHMGVNTSKALSLIETGENLRRHDEPSPTRSSVLVRLSHSHIRFGTFQRLAFFEDKDNLEKLVDYCRSHFYPDAVSAVGLLRRVVRASADTVAGWMAAGFVHGVMNTDNMNITGESFDYGPYRFLPTLQSGFTAAYFDHNGLYAFARQPEIMLWNLGQLAHCLAQIGDDKALIAALNRFPDDYRKAFRDHVFRRLSLVPTVLGADMSFVRATFKFLEESQTPWPQFWHDWQGGVEQEQSARSGPNRDHYCGDKFDDWFRLLKEYEGLETVEKPDTSVSLLYDEIGELWAPVADNDDWSAFHAKLETFARPAGD
ncbi:MAG: YdiU family protein [Hyphomonadaceae bacterium]|nr:YdiU family protein [Hyphomonadaceae bacterium]